MGDPYFRGMDWETITNNEANTSQRNENDNFIQCVRDSFLFQHITEPTRQRGSDKPSTLDLILTNEENMMSDIKIDSPIGASDHSFISFNLNCNIQSTPPKIKVMYDEGDYKKMRHLFHSLQDDVNAQWELFKNLYEKVEKECVPRKKVFINGVQSKKYSIPLDSANIKKINVKTNSGAKSGKT